MKRSASATTTRPIHNVGLDEQRSSLVDIGAHKVDQARPLSSKMKFIVEFIAGNLHRNPSLSELAALVQLTPGYFCGAFRQEVGQPPHQYLIEQRVERVRTLLKDPDLSLTEVALVAGFNSQSHMNNHFRRIVGLTPARYRKEVRLAARSTEV